MLDEVSCDEGRTLLRADDGLEPRPTGLQPLAAVDLLPLRRLLKAGIDGGSMRGFFRSSSANLARRLS